MSFFIKRNLNYNFIAVATSLKRAAQTRLQGYNTWNMFCIVWLTIFRNRVRITSVYSTQQFNVYDKSGILIIQKYPMDPPQSITTKTRAVV